MRERTGRKRMEKREREEGKQEFGRDAMKEETRN